MDGSEKHQKKIRGGWNSAVSSGKGVHGSSCVTVVLNCLVTLHPYIWTSLPKYCAMLFYLPLLKDKPFKKFSEYVTCDVEVSGVQIRLLLLLSLMNKWDFCGSLLVF